MLWLVQCLETAARLPPADAAGLEESARANLAAWRRELVPLRAILRHDDPRGDRLVAFSADGRTIGTAGWDNYVRLWDAATGKSLGPAFVNPCSDCAPLAFSPDCRTLLAGGGGEPVRLWDVGTASFVGASLKDPSSVL